MIFASYFMKAILILKTQIFSNLKIFFKDYEVMRIGVNLLALFVGEQAHPYEKTISWKTSTFI